MNGSGTSTRGYVYMGGQMLAIQYNNAVTWVHQEPLTKGQRLTDSSGAVVARVDLDPWGGETNRSWSSSSQPHKYTTYERDANQSDDAMHRRYDRWWSRFNQPDPYDGSYTLTDPQSLNRYSYVNNDPVNFVDPSGLFPGNLGLGTPTWTVNSLPAWDDMSGYLPNWGSGDLSAQMVVSLGPVGGGSPSGLIGPQNPIRRSPQERRMLTKTC